MAALTPPTASPAEDDDTPSLIPLSPYTFDRTDLVHVEIEVTQRYRFARLFRWGTIIFLAGTSSTIVGYAITHHAGFHSLVDPWVNQLVGLLF
jgi:hypothetical protein